MRAVVGCAGFGLTSLAIKEFGFEVIGIELDDAIAEVNRQNGGNCMTADFTQVDPRQFGDVDLFQISPPCPNFSQAKANAEESDTDIAIARQTCRYIRTLKPRYFMLENVWLYRQSRSWAMILRCLIRTGYKVSFWRLCAADYGGLIPCPIHHNVKYAENFLVNETAADVVENVATTNGDAARKTHARAVAALLVRAIQPAIAGNAIWPLSLDGISVEKLTPIGRVAAILMTGVMSKSVTTETTCENIGLWLKEFWVDHLLTKKWFITSTEIRLTTTRLICESLRATSSICNITTSETKRNFQIGESEISGLIHSCPLCQYSGTPQTRHRMIVLARRDGIKPHKPFPTHSKTPDMFCQPWVGWYEAIEDLVPGLPESQFAPWQLARLPGEIADHFIMSVGGNTNFNDAKPGNGARLAPEPYTSVMAQAKVLPRAFVVDQANHRGDNGNTTIRGEDEPIFTTTTYTTKHPTPRAFIADGKLNNHAAKLTTRDGESPAFTVTTSHNNRDVKAFVVSQDYGNSNSAPARVLSQRSGQEPIHTVKANGARGEFKAGVNGRVVSLTPRCLARFQDMPDWYELPPSNELACKGIGNGVPLNLTRAALHSLLETTQR